MKIRTDFITNSSSSSYVIGVKEDLTKKKLLQLFNVPNNSPMYSLTNELVDYIIRYSEKYTTNELLEDYCEDDISNLPKEYQNIINKGFNLYKGNASDEDGGIEAMFCNMDIQYEDDEIIIYKEGGY